MAPRPLDRSDPPAVMTVRRERVLHRWPLRYSVPIVLAVGALIAMFINAAWSIRVADAGVMRTGTAELRTHMRAATAAMERRATAGQDEDTLDALATLESDPRTVLAVIVDGAGRIVLARDPGLIGLDAIDLGPLAATDPGDAFHDVLASASIAATSDPSESVIERARGHALLAGKAVRYRSPSGTGQDTAILFVARRLAQQIRFERGVVLRSMAPLVAVMFGSTLVLWAIFELAVGRRLALLTRAAQRLAIGEPAVLAGVRGTDEVGRLGTAFDWMAAEIDARIDRREAALAVVEDRERIARDLHDHVIQRLFATGLTLQTASGSTDERTSGTLRAAVAELDDTIREIRSTIFGLHRHEQGLRADVLEIAAEYREVLGFLPEAVFEGPVDTIVDSNLQDDVAATVREALSNVARHARAHWARVTVHLGEDLEVSVVDDGVGLPAGNERSSGLANLELRAAAFGGALALHNRAEGGTVLTWRVPVLPVGAAA